MITVAEVRALEDWIAAGGSPEEIERRTKAVKTRLFDGVSDDEREEIERVIADADAQRKASDGDAIDDVLRRARGEVLPTPPRPERRRARLYDPARFSRATREEGIRDEIDAMNAEARGSPFYDAKPATAKRSTAPKSAQVSLLAKLKRP